MRIICEKGEFELPDGFQVEYSLNNVIISDAGEQTAPVTLPATPHNLSLIGHSHRPDSLYKPVTEMEVFVIDDGLHRPCNMGIHSASPAEGIGCTLYLDSGSLYSRMGNTRLNWFGWPELRSPDYDTTTTAERVQWLVNELKDEFFHPSYTRPWCVTALRTTKEMTWVIRRKVTGTRTSAPEEHTAPLILNDYRKYHDLHYETTPLGLWGYADDFSSLDGERTDRVYRADGVNVNVGQGFGMTAFLRVRYMLDFLFGYYGYTFDHTEIGSEVGGYDRLCVLNNVADAIYAGTLKYKQLVPDTTVKEFLAELQKVLGGVFVFDEARREAHFHFYERLLRLTPDLDLTPYASGEAVVGEAEFARVRVTGRNAPEEEGTGPGEGRSGDIEVGLPRQVYAEDGWWYVQLPAEQYDPPVDLQRGVYYWHASFPRRMAETDGIRLLNSELKLPEEEEEEQTPESRPTEDKEAEAGADITFLCARKVLHSGESVLEGRKKGTEEPLWFTLHCTYHAAWSLFPSGGYTGESDLEVLRGMYRAYTAFREHSNVPLTVTTALPPRVLHTMNLHTPKLLFGQPVLIERVEYASSTDGQPGLQTLCLRTLREYEDNEQRTTNCPFVCPSGGVPSSHDFTDST